jgi:CubicO group peptidase (beta-lactamase class C family)
VTGNGKGSRLCRVLAAACGALLTASLATAFEPLPRARPESVGVDAVALAAAVSELGRAEGARSAVIVYRGRVVAEERWIGPETALDDVRSVTKSVTSTLVALAIDHGFIGSIDDRMVDYLPPALVPADPAKDAITLRHLLTMTSGLEWNESTELYTWAVDPDPARFILERPLATTPGTRFNYSTAASHLLSVVLREATGLDPLDLADAYLFAPLGITDRAWLRDGQGRPFGSFGLQLRTEDLAKLGLLFLDRGRWDSQVVVPSWWVSEAVFPQITGFQEYGPLTNAGYGYLWWSADAGEHRVFIAWGWGGQFAFCVPDLDLVVATTARYNVPEDTANRQERAILEAIVTRLLPVFPVPARPPMRASRRAIPVPSTALRVSRTTSERSHLP